jgi:hypothetical protein
MLGYTSKSEGARDQKSQGNAALTKSLQIFSEHSLSTPIG